MEALLIAAVERDLIVNNLASQTLTLWHALHEYLIEKCCFDISIVT